MLLGSNPSYQTEDKLFPQKYTLQIKGRLISLDKPKIIGILNVTPDSFFEGSRVKNDSMSILSKAKTMIQEGADFLDLGGYSSRPNAEDISVQEEILMKVLDFELHTPFYGILDIVLLIN